MTLPYRPGDTGPHITTWQAWFTRAYRSYAPPVTGTYGPDDTQATTELQRRLGLPQTGHFDYHTAKAAGYTLPKHLAIVFRGTGGIIGEDYVSRVCQAVADLVDERNPAWAATMGGIPVGTAGSRDDPSMQRAVAAALDAGIAEFQRYRGGNPNIKVVIGGYSAGAIVAAKLRQWMLENHPGNYLCSFSIGDPSRPVGGAYHGGTPTPGRGISSWRYGDTSDPRHCWLAHPADMYTAVPDNATGDILQAGYDGITNTEFSNPVAAAQAIAAMVLSIMDQSGIPLPALAKAAINGPAALTGFILPVFINAISGFAAAITGQTGDTPGTAAGINAGIIALRFLAANPPTGPHITYEHTEVWPGQTYLGLAIQHVRDWATRYPPT